MAKKQGRMELVWRPDLMQGLDLTSPASVNKGFQEAENVVFWPDGSLKARGGVRRINAVQITEKLHLHDLEPMKITGLFDIPKLTTPVSFDMLVCAGTKVFKMDGDGTLTELHGGMTPNVRYTFAAYNDKVLMCNGVDQPLLYDRLLDTVTPVASAPLGNLCIVVNDRAFITGVANDPGGVYYSRSGDISDWTLEVPTTIASPGQFPVWPNRIMATTGMFYYAGLLFVQRTNALFSVDVRSTNPADWVVDLVTDMIGGVCPEVVVLNDSAIIPAMDGIFRFGGVDCIGCQSEKISKPITSWYLTLERYPTTEMSMVLLAEKDLIALACKVNGREQNNYILTFKHTSGQFSRWPVEATVLAIHHDADGQHIYGGSSDGYIREIGRDSVSSDDSSGLINCHWQTTWLGMDMFNLRKTFDTIVIDYLPPSVDITATLTWKVQDSVTDKVVLGSRSIKFLSADDVTTPMRLEVDINGSGGAILVGCYVTGQMNIIGIHIKGAVEGQE